MRTSVLLALTVSAATAAAASPTAPPGPAPLPSEQLTVESLGPTKPHWVFIQDEAFFNEIDSRIHLYDGDHFKELGQIDMGYTPGFNISPDGKTTVVATTYFARGSRGVRTDVVEFTDNSTLSVTREIVLPSKRAQTLPTYFNVAYSADSHFVYVSYVTPAASFGVLDAGAGKVLSEIDTAGCVLVIPSGPNRVSSLCESGRMLTVTLDAQGKESARKLSEPFFDPDADPLFVQGIPSTGGYTFLTFLGQVREVDMTGPEPTFRPAWSLVTPAEKGHWRPGGYQIGAIHRDAGKLYVPMHQGGEGSHKSGGSEIWVFDLKTHRRLARWAVAPARMTPVVAVQVSQDPAPVLFVTTEGAELAVLDATDGRVKHIEKHRGETAWLMMNP